MKTIAAFALVFLLGGLRDVTTAHAQAEVINVHLIGGANNQDIVDKKIVYTDHLNDPSAYALTEGINIRLNDYSPGEDIDLQLTGDGDGIRITPEQLTDFAESTLKIAPDGAIAGMPEGTPKVRLPFRIVIEYRAGEITSSAIGGKRAEDQRRSSGGESVGRDFCRTLDLTELKYRRVYVCDALKLAEGIKEKAVYDSLLMKYQLNIDSMLQTTPSNPVLDLLFKMKKEQDPKLRLVGFPKEKAGVQGLSLAGAVSGLASPTVLVEGLAEFITDRFRREFEASFFERFKKKLEDYPELQALLPTTTTLVTTMPPYDFDNYLTLLKAAFKEDLDDLPAGLKVFLDALNTHGKIQPSFREAYVFARFALDLTESVQAAKYPADVIESLPDLAADTTLKAPTAVAVANLAAGLSRSLRKGDNDRWVPRATLQLLLENADAIVIFAGLLLEDESIQRVELKPAKVGAPTDGSVSNSPGGNGQGDTSDPRGATDHSGVDGPQARRSVKYTDTTSLRVWLKDIEDLDGISSYVQRILNQVRTIEALLQNLEDSLASNPGRKLRLDQYYPYLNAAVEFLAVAVDLHAVTGKKVDLPITDTYLPVAKDVLKILESLSQKDKNYPLAFLSALDIINKVLPDTSMVKTEVLEYGSFMVNFVTAKTAEDVAQVLEAAALPVGSYRIKRESSISVGLNAYAGFTPLSFEKSTAEDAVNKDFGYTVSFTAPVGLAISRGWRGNSATAFIQVIDVGGLVSYRLSGGDTGFPEFEVENVVAPGLYLIIGFQNTPLSLGLGAQHGPELRKIEQVETMEGDTQPQIVKTSASAWRFGVTLTVDIPIFNFFSR